MNSTPNEPPSRPRILVAEDSPLNLQIALKQLEKLGFTAEGVPDGRRALDAVERAVYDIILMDCQMPELNGYEATWQIRDREKRALDSAASPGEAEGQGPKPIYIIAMTANARADNRDKCLAAGMDDYIRKPVELPELESALLRGLQHGNSDTALDGVVDQVVIAGLRQLGVPGKPNPLGGLIDLFFDEAPQRIEELATAIGDNNETSLTRVFSAASALKGSASNLGARSFAALCDEIEQTARVCALSEVQPLIERAREEFARVCEALKAIKKRETGSGAGAGFR
jgi:CheY-like chemotaxis protein